MRKEDSFFKDLMAHITGRRTMTPAEYLEAVRRGEISAEAKVTFLIPDLDTDQDFGLFLVEEKRRAGQRPRFSMNPDFSL